MGFDLKAILGVFSKLLDVIRGFQKKSEKKDKQKEVKKKNSQLDELQAKYDKAVDEGDIAGMAEYRARIDRFLHNN